MGTERGLNIVKVAGQLPVDDWIDGRADVENRLAEVRWLPLPVFVDDDASAGPCGDENWPALIQQARDESVEVPLANHTVDRNPIVTSTRSDNAGVFQRALKSRDKGRVVRMPEYRRERAPGWAHARDVIGSSQRKIAWWRDSDQIAVELGAKGPLEPVTQPAFPGHAPAASSLIRLSAQHAEFTVMEAGKSDRPGQVEDPGEVSLESRATHC
jgi:hypothetical protein